MPIERYVPVDASLTSDAPGWGANVTMKSTVTPDSSNGPICWKCKGVGRVKGKSKKQKKADSTLKSLPNQDMAIERSCPICQGKGYMNPKKTDTTALCSIPPTITRKRKAPIGWKESGPVAYAVQQMEDYMQEDCQKETINSWNESKQNCHPLVLLYLANHLEHSATLDCKVGIPVNQSPSAPAATRTTAFTTSCQTNETYHLSNPPWLPTNPGEQLCNLVGSWRILQRVGSHRWTTDDIVTAHVAIHQVLDRVGTTSDRSDDDSREGIRYLDLGCGNASVLQMVSWGLLNHFNLTAYGVEARSEAVSFARRSLSFNIGTRASKSGVGNTRKDMGVESAGDDNAPLADISIIHSDFRQLYLDGNREEAKGFDSQGEEKAKIPTGKIDHVKSQKFHLITGTPPYFRVDFHLQNETNVKAAVINQGGMPTSIQSAPARCEYRGGVEAYCAAASQVLADDGVFVVCENWLNDERVYEGANASGLTIVDVIPVKGKSNKNDNLFAVYVMVKKGGVAVKGTNIRPPLCVRDANGKWTSEYARLMEEMSIPTSGKYI